MRYWVLPGHSSNERPHATIQLKRPSPDWLPAKRCSSRSIRISVSMHATDGRTGSRCCQEVDRLRHEPGRGLSQTVHDLVRRGVCWTETSQPSDRFVDTNNLVRQVTCPKRQCCRSRVDHAGLYVVAECPPGPIWLVVAIAFQFVSVLDEISWSQARPSQ